MSSANFNVAFDNNYWSNLLSFRDMTTDGQQTTDGPTSHIWLLRRASNKPKFGEDQT